MNNVITYLTNWINDLSEKTSFDSIEDKANHIGLINSVGVAIKQIELCEKYNINPGSWFCVFPERVPGFSAPKFRVASELYTPTIAPVVPKKIDTENSFSDTNNLSNDSKAFLHQTRQTNGMPTSDHCPGKLKEGV